MLTFKFPGWSIAVAVSTISVKLSGARRAIMLCSIWSFCYLCFLFSTGQCKVISVTWLQSHNISFSMAWLLFLNDFGSVMNHFPLSGTVLSASVLVGFTTSLILFCSHFHQVLLSLNSNYEYLQVGDLFYAWHRWKETKKLEKYHLW